MRLVFVCLLIVAAATVPCFAEGTSTQASAHPNQRVGINIGKTPFDVPIPEGFAGFSAENPATRWYFDEMQALGDSKARLCVYCIDSNQLPNVIARQLPELGRALSMRVAASTQEKAFNAEQFAQFKADLFRRFTTEFEDFRRNASAKFDEGLNRFNDLSDIKKSLLLKDVVALPIHAKDSRSISGSMYVKIAMPNDTDTPEQMIRAVTVTAILIRGKIVNLYASGAEGDLEWTRIATRQWAEMLFAANPELTPRKGPPGFVLASSITAFALVCVSALWLWNRWRKNRPDRMGA